MFVLPSVLFDIYLTDAFRRMRSFKDVFKLSHKQVRLQLFTNYLYTVCDFLAFSGKSTVDRYWCVVATIAILANFLCLVVLTWTLCELMDLQLEKEAAETSNTVITSTTHESGDSLTGDVQFDEVHQSLRQLFGLSDNPSFQEQFDGLEKNLVSQLSQ